MPDQIFISYRRDDAAYVTGHINDLLRKEFGNESVFTDVDNIALGVDFRKVLDQSVSQCQVLLAVIGDNWLTVKNQEGNPRLQDPADFVRIEIESALKRNIPVIPLLVGRATMPLAEELPESLKDLAFRNGTQIRPAPDFNVDMDRLIRNLRRYLQSIRKDAGEKQGRQVATGTSRSGEIDQQPRQARSESRRDVKKERRKVPREQFHVGAEERVRKQAELGIGQHLPKKRWGARLWLITILAVVAASWYYADQNPAKIQAVLTAVQASNPEAEENLVTSEDTETRRPGDADSTGEVAVGAPTSFAAPTEDDAGEDPPANLTADSMDETGTDAEATLESEPEMATEAAANLQYDPETAAQAVGNLTAGTTTVDGAETTPESAAEAEGETSDNTGASLKAETDAAANLTDDSIDEAGDDVEVNLTESTDTEPDAEIILSPGTQRQADAAEFIREGVALAADGDHEAAIQNFDEAIQLNVEAAFVYRQRGASFHVLEQYEAAVRDYGEAIRLNGEDVNAYYNRSASHLALQDYAAAVLDYDEVIRLDPEFVEAYSKRADAHEAMGNVDEAARDRAITAVFESNRDNPR